MNLIRVVDEVDGVPLGATRGALVFDRCVEALRQGNSDTVVLSFEGVEATNASFVKATLLSLLWCAKLSLDPEAALGTSVVSGTPVPLDCYPVVSRCEPDVLAELDEVFVQRERNYLLATGPDSNPLAEGEVRGILEVGLRETYLQFQPGEELSAAELRRRNPSGVAGTIWNNRLGALHSMRLIKRRKVGREWIFSTVINRSKIWENGLFGQKLNLAS
jgi:hypothetical protein